MFVYEAVKRIPKGKVATYGQVAELTNKLKLKTENKKATPRIVGNALHKNPVPKAIPCHRVVNNKGKLAGNYAFGGWKKQKEKLLREGIGFKDPLHVDLGKHLYVW